jgi:hypothetical protein
LEIKDSDLQIVFYNDTVNWDQNMFLLPSLVIVISIKITLNQITLNLYNVGFEVLTSVVTDFSIFWDIAPCSP